MAIPFPRSTRSLQADGYRYTVAALGVAAILLLIWGIWFFGSTVTFVESSNEAQLTDDEFIEAWFDKNQLHRIARGQLARFYPDGEAEGSTGGIHAIVTLVERTPQASHGQVELVVLAEQRGGLPRAGKVPRAGYVPRAGNVRAEYVPRASKAPSAEETPPTEKTPQATSPTPVDTRSTAAVNGRIEIEVEHVAPARLVLNGTGFGSTRVTHDTGNR